MSNAATWNDELFGSTQAERTSAGRRALALSAFVLVTTVLLCGGLYWSGRKTLHSQVKEAEERGSWKVAEKAAESYAVLLQAGDHLALSITGVALVGGFGALVPLYLAATSWRRRMVSELQEKAEEWKTTATAAQNQMAELRRVRDGLLVKQAELEESVKSLSTEKSRLQEEVDKRNRSERALTQRRQELESSKSVLELHVQARTQELQVLQRRYEMILNSAGEGICGLDVEDKTTFVNPTVAKLTGWPVEELIGKAEKEIFHVNGENGANGIGALHPGERVFHRKDGTHFPVEFVKTPINEGGRVIGSVLVFKDITERKRVEETLSQRAAELARSNSELEQFAFVASHDLQEPLRKIQAFGDRLKVKCEGIQGPEIADYLTRMQSAAARMRNLIDDLLAFSRVIRSSEPFVEVDLGQITREVLVDLELRIEKSGAKVEVGTLPKLDADPMQMRQLLLNLITNALKFQPPGAAPVVKINARTFTALSGEQLCELSVQDNGIGFDEKYLDRIFAVFQRLHGRSEYEGTGVGLAVCRRIIDRHHGQITARSQPGQGATFMVTLPIRQTQPKPQATA
jgi:PAS domain S-box-containing protein